MAAKIFWFYVCWALWPTYRVGVRSWYGWATGKFARAAMNHALSRQSR